MRRSWVGCPVVVSAALVVSLTGPTALAATPSAKFSANKAKAKKRPRGALRLAVLSSRPDLVSAGDALVRLTVPPATNLKTLRVRLGTKDVTAAFSVRADGRRLARLSGLALGRNRLVAGAHRMRSAVLILTNHPGGGPLFAGPQPQPWVCPRDSEDKQCATRTRYEYAYLPEGGRDLLGYNRSSPPQNVATTTTDAGVSVPFIVRTETGYVDRDEYRISTLFQPGEPWEPWDPQRQFNHKLLVTHGAGCGAEYRSGSAPSTTADTALADRGILGRSPTVALGRGFAVMSTALANSGHNCNLVTQAEALTMLKERVIERYGELRFTIGAGCSGGSIAIQQVANAYPGIFDGLVPQCSLPDAWSSATQFFDLHLLRRYLEHPERWGLGVIWDPLSVAAVDGHPNHASAIVQDDIFNGAFGNPAYPCGGTTDATRWSPSRPAGLRCTLADLSLNVLGGRSGDGYGGRPLDNVGVQYGLAALQRGALTPAQFTELNARIGGEDVNGTPTAARTTADQPALANVYRSGGVNDARQLDRVPIIDLRGSDDGLLHDAYRSFALRARLDRAHGTHANQVIWQGPVPAIGGTDFSTRGLLAMDRWLTAIARDSNPGSLPAKVIRNRPADVRDRCELATGLETTNCSSVVRAYQSPRMVAGDAVTTTTNKCRLKPLRRGDYAVSFTAGQWARLAQAFPTGVCDFTQPGVDEVPSVPWLTYAGGPGGQPLPDM